MTEQKPSFLTRVQSCTLWALAVMAVMSLSAACGAIIGFLLVPPVIKVNDRICPTTASAPLECPAPEQIHGSIPSIPKLRMEITSQKTSKDTDQLTGKLTENREVIHGKFFVGKQVVRGFSIYNDHLTKRSEVHLQSEYNPYPSDSPDGLRYQIMIYQNILPQIEPLIKYPVMK